MRIRSVTESLKFHAQLYDCTDRSLLMQGPGLTLVPGGSQEILRNDAAPVLFAVHSPSLGSTTQTVDDECS